MSCSFYPRALLLPHFIPPTPTNTATRQSTLSTIPTPAYQPAFFGWAFPKNDPLFWGALARVEHLRLLRLNARIQDNIYTTGHDYIDIDGHPQPSEIDFGARIGFRPVRTPGREFWVFDRIFLGPIFKHDNRLSVCWSKLSTAESYQLEMRGNQGEWEQIYQGFENDYRYTPKRDGRYEFRVKPLLKNRESSTKALLNDRKGLEERWSQVRLIDFHRNSSTAQSVDTGKQYHQDWQFRSALFNWRYEGWKRRNDQDNIESKITTMQNLEGTVTIDDPSHEANLYIVHNPDWKTPFTVQVRLKVDYITGNEVGELPAINCFIKDKVSIQLALHQNGISTWSHDMFYSVDTSVFHTYTIVVGLDGSARVYVDDNFSTSVLYIRRREMIFPPNTRLEIGSPTKAVSKITVDSVSYTQGVVLGLASVPDWIDIDEATPLF